MAPMTSRLPAPSRRGRSRAGTAALIVLVWAGSAVFVLVFAAKTAVGPVVFKFSRAHGVHLGDALVLLALTTVAAVLTWLLVRRGRRPEIMVDDGGLLTWTPDLSVRPHPPLLQDAIRPGRPHPSDAPHRDFRPRHTR